MICLSTLSFSLNVLEDLECEVNEAKVKEKKLLEHASHLIGMKPI